MTLTIIRRYFNVSSTVGELLVDGKFFCHTLEDRDRGLTQYDRLTTIRDTKVPGQTAIPRGRYTVRFTYSPRFGRETLQVTDVPGFEGIRIHAGNTADDTEGCILLGDRAGEGRVKNSRKRVRELEALLRQSGETEWTLTVIRS